MDYGTIPISRAGTGAVYTRYDQVKDKSQMFLKAQADAFTCSRQAAFSRLSPGTFSVSATDYGSCQSNA